MLSIGLYAHKAYICTLFKTFSNQPLWVLHEIVNKITWKRNAMSKKRSFQKCYSRHQCQTL